MCFGSLFCKIGIIESTSEDSQTSSNLMVIEVSKVALKDLLDHSKI